MRDGASRPFNFSCGIRRFALIASQKSHDKFCFCLYRAVNSGRELVCGKKNFKLISKRIVRFLIATPRSRRPYRENGINRWLITRRCGGPQAKPAVSEERGFSLLYIYIYGRRAEEPTTVRPNAIITGIDAGLRFASVMARLITACQRALACVLCIKS